MRRPLFPRRHQRRPKLINAQVTKTNPEEYGKKHVTAIQNAEGFYKS